MSLFEKYMYSHMIYKVVGMTASLSGQDIDDDRTTAYIYIYKWNFVFPVTRWWAFGPLVFLFTYPK
jgi:hypothetical protein